MLYPIDLQLSASLSENMHVLDFTYDRSREALHLSVGQGLMHAGPGTIAVLRCLVLIGNAQQCDLNFSNNFSFGRGARIEQVQHGTFTLTDYCDAEGRRLLNERSGPRISAVTPNPLKDAMTIEFVLDSDGHTEMLLYDIAGRLIERLLDGSMTTGTHTLHLPMLSLRPGVYHVALRQNGLVVYKAVMKAR